MPENLLGKAAAIKRFEYSPLGSELRKKIGAAEKQYQSIKKQTRFSNLTKGRR